MVTVASTEATKYTVDISKHILMKGFINGNWGEGFIVWLETSTAAVAPGFPLVRGVIGNAADSSLCTESGANDEVGFGVAEFDQNQIGDAEDTYASGDLIPVLPYAQNAGMIFQGWVLDTNGNKVPDTQYDHGAAGFAVADFANKGYAAQWNYVADTGATAQHLILYLLTGGHGG